GPKHLPGASIIHVPLPNHPSPPPASPPPQPGTASAAAPRSGSRYVEPLLLIAFVLVALYFARIVLLPLAIALALNFLLSPAVSAFERAHIRRIPAVILVVLMSFALAGGVGW